MLRLSDPYNSLKSAIFKNSPSAHSAPGTVYESRCSHRSCSVKKMFLEISQQENIFARGSFLIKLRNFIKKETLAPMFSCEFCEIFENTFFYRTPPGDCFSFLNAPTKILTRRIDHGKLYY